VRLPLDDGFAFEGALEPDAVDEDRLAAMP
jgi:hypothetical protein